MKKTVLIAEDAAVNRRILQKILSADYQLLLAENGQEAMETLAQAHGHLAAIILDLQMPVMSGYDVMQAIAETEAYRNIPILVTTGSNDKENELRALALGAWDFVAKPYNAEILKFRLNNAIERSKLNLFEQLKRQAEIDKLTGLYNEQKFYQETRQLLDAQPQGQFMLIRFDIDRFKQFNSFFGIHEGDRFLQYVAQLLRDAAAKTPTCVYGRIESDVFAVCLRYTELSKVRRSIRLAQEQIRCYSSRFDIVTVFGLYIIDDLTIPVNRMLDRATLAARTCKGNYIETIALYTEEMGKAVEQEQEIVNEMSAALEGEQFCVYYQPKFNLSSCQPSGAEALVRWRHPKKGLISPGVFIPVFEKNGFVAKMDYFVWERVCRNLKKWCDEGLMPDPISVNISRVNLSNPQIVEILTALVERYGLPPRLLQLEITESAYMDNPEIMDQLVEHFHRNGFTILMDDFGSGYSSLNTLKDISVDILKIDMKFLPTGDDNAKSEKILASMIRMADWIGMPVICEGVETAEQRDFLLSVGCLFAQGYLFGRPMPVEEYHALLCQSVAAPVGATAVDDNASALNALLSSDQNTETLLRSIAIPVVIYAYTNGKYDHIRANQCFYDTFDYQSHMGMKLVQITPDGQQAVDRAFEQVVRSRAIAECDALFIMKNGAAKWFRLTLRYILPSTTGHIICAVFNEITSAKRVEMEMLRIAGILNQPISPSQAMLVIDDSEISRAVLKGLFSQDFRIFQAANGQEALDILQTHIDEISIILLDMIMPVMDGAEFLALKSSMDAAAQIPVVVISAENREHVQVNMLRSGVNDYITKPFVPEVVQRRVRNVLDYQSRFSELVQEYRQAIAVSPDIASHLTDAYLKLDEMRVLLSFLTPVFDVVRLVDPKTTCILTIDAQNQVQRQPYSCFRVWKKDTRCDNCTSLCAMQQGCQMTKYEFIENNIFYVVSRPISLITGERTVMNAVLEIVSHVSDSILSSAEGGSPLQELMEHTREQIYCDPLTGTYNRRYLYEMLFCHKGRTDTTRQIAFLMMDLNSFKSINDSFGHAEGDKVLRHTAKALLGQLRQTDSLVRYGGDEFLIILTGCTQAQAEIAVGRFRRALCAVTAGPERVPVTAAFGCACTQRFDSTREALEALIKAADLAMYQSKASGLVPEQADAKDTTYDD